VVNGRGFKIGFVAWCATLALYCTWLEAQETNGTLPQVTAWFKGAAIPLDSTEPASGLKDMERLDVVIGNARIVAMGESTHGTREFFQMKHRMLEYLVEEKGFTVFGIEANWPESLAVNEYVLNGSGDAQQALDGLYFWTSNTQEMLEMIRWIRKYNGDPRHTKKVKFYGFDMQVAHLAARNVESYLDKVDPQEAKVAAMVFAPVSDAARERESAGKSRVFWGQLEDRLQMLVERMENRKKDYVQASSLEAWILARHNLETVKQAAEMYAVDKLGNVTPRDVAMAENVKWILEQEGPGAKIMLWAHNGHVSTAELGSSESMGGALRDTYGSQMVVCGFAFGEGSFQAIQRGKGLTQFSVGPAATGSVDGVLAGIGRKLFAVDLRPAPNSGTVGEWLNEPQKMRSIGAVFGENWPDGGFTSTRPRSFDVLFFVQQTTAARENHKYSEIEFRGGS
jgi:erythromycin esterase